MDSYRQNAGILLINHKGEVLIGTPKKAYKADTWQMPQGGINKNEDPLHAAQRELFEETGVHEYQFIASTNKWYTYDFPTWVLEEKRKTKPNFAYIGQTQKWFLFLYTGTDIKADLRTRQDKELFHFRWAPLETLPDKVVDFKQSVYQQVVKDFSPLIAQWLQDQKKNK